MYYTTPPASHAIPLTFPPARRVTHADIQQLRQEPDSVKTRMDSHKQMWAAHREREQQQQQQQQQQGKTAVAHADVVS